MLQNLTVFQKRAWVAVAVISVLFLFGKLWLTNRTQSDSEPQLQQVLIDTNPVDVMFAGNLGGVADDIETIGEAIALFTPDLFVFGGDRALDQQSYDEVNRVIDGSSKKTLDVLGDRDREFRDAKTNAYSSEFTGDTQHISLDTNELVDSGENCEFGQDQLDFLDEALGVVAANRIVYTHHALWFDEAVKNAKPNTVIDCGYEYWQQNIHPKLEEAGVDLVVSGDAGNPSVFYDNKDREGVRYILSGNQDRTKPGFTRSKADSRAINILRIRIVEGKVIVNEIRFGEPSSINTDVLSDLPQYELEIDASLDKIYQEMPMYDKILDEFRQLVEDEESLDIIQQKYNANLKHDGQTFTTEASLRGNLGNHWNAYKKSWDVSFTDSDNRQLKFIQPLDRRFVNQMFAQVLSESIGVGSPDVSIGRLVVNGVDFGTYLIYEDFDKAYVELEQLNSDVPIYKNTFTNQFGAYNVLKGINFVQRSGGDDKSDAYNLVDGITPENFTDIFDADIFARWVALQVYMGDRHQNMSDNFRFTIDKATGRYVMFTWDPFFTKTSVDDIYPKITLHKIALQDEEVKQLVDKYVRELLDSHQENIAYSQ